MNMQYQICKIQDKEFKFLKLSNFREPIKPKELQKTFTKYLTLGKGYDLSVQDVLDIAKDSKYSLEDIKLVPDYSEDISLEVEITEDNKNYDEQYKEYEKEYNKYCESKKEYDKIIKEQNKIREEALKYAFDYLKENGVEQYQQYDQFLKLSPDIQQAITMIIWINTDKYIYF